MLRFYAFTLKPKKKKVSIEGRSERMIFFIRRLHMLRKHGSIFSVFQNKLQSFAGTVSIKELYQVTAKSRRNGDLSGSLPTKLRQSSYQNLLLIIF